MIYGVRFKPGVLPIRMLSPAGVRILAALDRTARTLGHDLTVTCIDKDHPSTDPHTMGEAVDVRTHDLEDDAQKDVVLRGVMRELADNHGIDAPQEVAIGLATLRFYGQIEDRHGPDEHLHVQRRKGTVYL